MTRQMRAMVLQRLCRLDQHRQPLTLAEMPVPTPGDGEILIRVDVCGVCHTELDVIEGRTPLPRLPLVPGHQVVGRVEAAGPQARSFGPGDRVGVAWIHSACGACRFCRSGRENLCPDFQATGRDSNGGYAQYLTVSEDFAHRIPAGITDAEAAPLLCAGAVGYRSVRLAGLTDGDSLGLAGFGASAHLVLKMVRHRYPRSRIFVFARSRTQRDFALALGASWVGDVDTVPPIRLDCIIDTTPAWRPLLAALANLQPGGRLVVNAIGKEDHDKDALLGLDYARHLWLEKEIKSVANVSRADVGEFLALAAAAGIRPEVQEFSLEDANIALCELRERKIRGAKVLRIGASPTLISGS